MYPPIGLGSVVARSCRGSLTCFPAPRIAINTAPENCARSTPPPGPDSAPCRTIAVAVIQSVDLLIGRLPARIAELKKDLYACEWFKGGQYIADPDGFDDWFPSHLQINVPPAVNSPVRADPRAISVQLPDTMSSREFDRAFDAEVRKGALDLWVRSREGQRHCAALGVDPAIAQRFTPYPFGAAARRSPVTEIVSFRKHCDPDRLVAIAERVILQHMGLIS